MAECWCWHSPTAPGSASAPALGSWEDWPGQTSGHVVGPESHRADSDRLWGVSQQEGSDAGGCSADGLGKFGMVSNAATKGMVTLTPHPSLTHVAVAPVPWVLPGRGVRRAVLQDVKSWVNAWLDGLPNFPLPPPSPHPSFPSL